LKLSYRRKGRPEPERPRKEDLMFGTYTVPLSIAQEGISLSIQKDGKNLEVLVKVTSYSIFIVALIIILPLLGVRLSGLLVAGGIAGLAIGFASQSVIGNLISELFLIEEHPLILINPALEKEGIEIPFPQRVVWFANELRESGSSGS
jgi:small-conductance mechanosensitive channel